MTMCVTFLLLWIVATGSVSPVTGVGNASCACSPDQGPADYAFGRGVSGSPCRTSCAAGGGQCFVDTSNWSPRLEKCWYLQYYTAQFTGKQLCTGPCTYNKVRNGYTCPVDTTSSDYCNPLAAHEPLFVGRAVGGERCAGACTGDTRGVYVCRKQSGVQEQCFPRAGLYFRAQTWDRRPCVDPCEPREGTKGLQCHAADGYLRLCAPPARFYMRAVTTPPV